MDTGRSFRDALCTDCEEMESDKCETKGEGVTESNPETNENVKLVFNDDRSPTGVRVDDVHFKRFLTRFVLDFWPDRHNDFQFPGPLPVSIERKDLYKIKKFPYVVSNKTDGVRFMMICVRYKDEPYCVLVNRSFTFCAVNDQKFDEEVYDGTLLDGELAKNNKGEWHYLVHDVVSAAGRDVSKDNWSDRNMNLTKIVDTAYKGPGQFTTTIKEFYHFSQLGDVINQNSNEFKSDGLVFTPQLYPIGMGTQYTLFKWKPQTEHTFDFKVTKPDDTYSLNIFHKGNIVEYRTELGEDFGTRAEKLDGYVDGCIVECSHDQATGTYTPLVVRKDKTHPNGLKTVQKTILNIQENITQNDLLNIDENDRPFREFNSNRNFSYGRGRGGHGRGNQGYRRGDGRGNGGYSNDSNRQSYRKQPV